MKLVSRSMPTNRGNRIEQPPRTFHMTKCVCDVLHIAVDHYLGGEPNTHLQPDEIDLLENYRLASDELKAAVRVIMAANIPK